MRLNVRLFYGRHPQPLPQTMNAWEKIKADVEAAGNVKTVPMEVLRNAHLSGRTSERIRSEISESLQGIGLAHVPKTLPRYQHDLVRLYKRGTPVGNLIDLILEPSEEGDDMLTSRSEEPKVDYAAIVRQIRDLVSE